MQSKFFAYLSRLRWIKRWGLKRNIEDENVMEHNINLNESVQEKEVRQIIKAADTISAYLKCQYEINNGNKEFTQAAEEIAKKLENYQEPEVRYFMDIFVISYELTLDGLLSNNNIKD